MWRGHRATARIFVYAVGVGNFILLILGEHSVLILSLAVMLAPFTLDMALTLTAFVACSVLSLALSDGRGRAELLAQAIGRMQPPSAGERYREAMLADIHDADSDQIRKIQINLIITAPRNVLGAWGFHATRPLRKRIRNAVDPSTNGF